MCHRTSFGSPSASLPPEMRYNCLTELTSELRKVFSAMEDFTNTFSLSAVSSSALICESSRDVSEEGTAVAQGRLSQNVLQWHIDFLN